MFANPRSLIVAAVFAVGLVAQDNPPPIDAALRARFGFLGPVNHKVGTGLSFLRAVDWDGDGDDEVVVFHSHRGRLVVINRATGEKPSVRKDGNQKDGAQALGEDTVVEEYYDTEGGISGLAFGDVDGDGSMDLLLLDRRGRLSVRLRGKKPRRLPDIEVGIAGNNNAMSCGDIDGDHKADALVMTRDGLRTVLQIAGVPVVSDGIPVGGSSPRHIVLRDCDGDSALDIILSVGGRMPLRVRRGDGKGGFGPWLLFRIDSYTAAFAGPGSNGKPTISVIQSRRGRIVDYRLERSSRGSSPALQFTSLPPTKRGAYPFAHGDVDGDGDLDLVLAHPDRAELTLLREVDGQFERETAPTLAGVSSVAMGDVDGDGRMDIVIASRDEETLAWKRGGERFDKFPTTLPFKGRPVAVGIEADGSVIVMSRDSKRMAKLWRIDRSGDGFASPVLLVDLGKLVGEPNRLILAELDGVPGTEIAFVVPSDGLRVVRFRDGAYIAPPPKSKAPGFTRKMGVGALSLVPGEEASLMVVRDRYARRIRYDHAGQPAILEQRNGPAGSLGLELGAVDSRGNALLFDGKSDKLFRLAKSGATESFDMPDINAAHVLPHGDDVLVLGSSGLVRLTSGAAWQLKTLRDHEPPTKATEYWYGLPGDFDHDGTNELALIDEDINGIQILVADGGALRRALSFPVLELHDKSESVWEPSWAVVGDWNGDGRDDLILKAYDRVLIYIQEL